MTVKTYQLECPFCNKESFCEIINEHSRPFVEYDENGNEYEISKNIYYILRCCGCKERFFRVTYISPNDDISHEYYPHLSKHHLIDMNIYRGLRTIPKYGEFCSCLYDEISKALNAEFWILTSAGLRTLFDTIAKYVLNETKEENKTFAQRLKELLENEQISKKQYETLQNFLEVGHAAVHRNNIPLQQDINHCMAIIENIIESLVIFPEKNKELAKYKKPPKKQQ